MLCSLTIVILKLAIISKLDNTVDQDYFAADCVHWSVKGQEALAAEIWNNLVSII
jgi:hypothetical protein